jgi:DNA replication and repair protein RecF
VKVRSLVLRNFRNATELRVEPGPQLNFFVGANGQGKTSILEALGFLATLRSFRGSKTHEVIRYGERFSEVACEIGAADAGGLVWKTGLKVVFEQDPSSSRAVRTAFINDKPFKSSTQYLSQRFGSFELGFHSVVFNPSDHDLVRGEPACRRSYLDRTLAAEDVEYLKASQRYQRLLTQRNALLKTGEQPPIEVMAGFTEPLAHLGAQLTFKRLKWIQKLTFRVNDILHQIAPSEPELRVIYLSNWSPLIDNLSISNNNLSPIHFTGHGHLPSLELLEQAFWKRLSNLEAAEWRSGHSLVGPHRDDWAFFLGNQVLKGHGSQGEVRSALLALKLAEIDLFQDETGHRPLFLLDDFSSELDQQRRSFLLRFLMETDLQVFVTSTEDSGFQGKRFWVSRGTLRESNDARAESKLD